MNNTNTNTDQEPEVITLNTEIEIMDDNTIKDGDMDIKGNTHDSTTKIKYKTAAPPSDSVSNRITVLSNRIIQIKKQQSQLSEQLKKANKKMATLRKIEKQLSEL